MKYSLILSSLILLLFSCNLSTDADYKAMAKDTCDCVSLFTSDLSPEMIKIIDDSNGDETKLQNDMMAYVQENPVEGMKDAQLLQDAGNLDKMTTCMNKIEKKYDDVYTTLSEDEVVQKLITEFEKMDGCKTSISILKMGLASK